jgi:hypothetical protein
MRLKKILLCFILAGFFGFPMSASSEKETERWAYGPWQTEAMLSLGNEVLIVDYGQNGLWSYNGSWIRLSHLDPLRMVKWGESVLVVDFGSHGLWKFDQAEWVKIAL